MKLTRRQIRAFQKTIWDYYREHRRRFPWRQTNDPYRVLVSEVMLQQTQVDRVVPKYREWMRRFPTVTALARAPLKKVLRTWSGLGYNRRALFLKRAAEVIVRDHGGRVPRSLEKLNALPGIGRDTASAVLAFAWNEPTVFIETNIRTVYLHFFFRNRKRVKDREILELVGQTLPKTSPTRRRVAPKSIFLLKNLSGLPRAVALRSCESSKHSLSHPLLRGNYHPQPLLGKEGRKRATIREWYDALMDYGAMLKETQGNQNVRSAHYTRQKRFVGSRRELRGKIVRFLTNKGRGTRGEIRRAAQGATHDLPVVLTDLVREGFLKKDGKVFKLQ